MDELNKIIDRYTEGNYLIGKTAKEEMAKDILALFSVVGQTEQFYCDERDKYGNTDCTQQCMACVRDEQAKQ